MADDWQHDARRERRSTALRLLASVVVLGGAYAGLCAWSSQHLPATVSVGGIAVGGMTTESAHAAVVRGSKPLLDGPITLHVPGRDDPLEVVPREAGLRVDVDRSLEGLTGFTLDPRTVWERLVGEVDAPLLTSADDDALTRYVERLAPRTEVAPAEGRISFPGGAMSVDLPERGHVLDVVGTKFALRKAFPDAVEATAVVREVEPRVSGDTVQRVASAFGSTAVSRPLVLVAGRSRVLLDPVEYAPLVSVVPDGSGGLVPHFDGPKLAALVASKVTVVTRPARSARWVLDAHGRPPTLVPSVDGLALDEADLVERVTRAISGADRTVLVRAGAARPPFTTDDARRAGVTTLVADVRLPLAAGGAGRTTDVLLAARRVNGTFVRPGGTFSLNAVLGEPGEVGDDPDGAVVVDGRPVAGTRGGVTQVSTVVHDLAWLAGVPILERTPPAHHDPHRPVGRDAALAWPSLDNRWRNDTPFGMLVQTWVEGGVLHGRIWGTKTWDVRSVTGPRTAVVTPRTTRGAGAGCTPRSARPGFDVTVTRQWFRPGTGTGAGAPVRSESVSTHYLPLAGVVCTGSRDSAH